MLRRPLFAGLCLAVVLGAVQAKAQTFPGAAWQLVSPAQAGMDPAQVQAAINYAQARGRGNLLVSRGGKQVIVQDAGSTGVNVDLKSSTKSYGGVLVCIGVGDGKISLAAKASVYNVPQFGTPSTNLAGNVTLVQLATHTAGFDKQGGFIPIIFTPVGSAFAYSDGGANWLADVMTVVYRKDMADLFRERIGSRIGSTISWRLNAYRPRTLNGFTRREFGSGISASVDDMARLGLLLLRNGRWNSVQVIPANCDELARATPVRGKPVKGGVVAPGASNHYGHLFWNNADGWMAEVPRDAFWSWGLGESFILVVPSKDLVVARTGDAWQRRWEARDTVLEGFFQRIVQAVN